MSEENDKMSVQGKFVTRESEYSVPADAIALEGSFGPEQLSAIINQLLNREGDDEVDFEFFIQDNIIQESIKEHLADNGINAENVIEVSIPGFQEILVPCVLLDLVLNLLIQGEHITEDNRVLRTTNRYNQY